MRVSRRCEANAHSRALTFTSAPCARPWQSVRAAPREAGATAPPEARPSSTSAPGRLGKGRGAGGNVGKSGWKRMERERNPHRLLWRRRVGRIAP
eukprot:425421-Pleurochrysis_carterae.AAC.2